MSQYHFPTGGLPPQRQIMSDRAVFTPSYAVIPKGVMTDIVTSKLPHWENARFWVIARPLTGFAETFSHYIAEVSATGGSQTPDTDPTAQSILFVVHGTVIVALDGVSHTLTAGGYAYLPAGSKWKLSNTSASSATFHWIRKRYQAVRGIDHPTAFFTNERDVAPNVMANTTDWSTTRFVEPDDLRHDCHVNIVNFKPGGSIPFAETHVMEHGLYVLQGKAVYHLNQDWVEVEAGDYMWLRAFCPQACIAAGPEPFRYLLYKDVNRHMSFL
jgi:(S)-ureidoglycine aminohydrolase